MIFACLLKKNFPGNNLENMNYNDFLIGLAIGIALGTTIICFLIFVFGFSAGFFLGVILAPSLAIIYFSRNQEIFANKEHKKDSFAAFEIKRKRK